MDKNTPPPNPETIHYAAKKFDKSAIAQGVTAWLAAAEESLRLELAEEVQSGDYDGKEMLWKALVHSKSLDMLDQHEDMADAIRVAIIQVIENEALYHYAGCETCEEFFFTIGSDKSRGERSDLLNLARIATWVKQNNVELYEPVMVNICNRCSHLLKECRCQKPIYDKKKMWQESPVDDWFMSNNKDGSSRRRRLRAAVPELRRIIGLNEKESYVPVLQAEIREELEKDNDFPREKIEAEVQQRVIEQQKTFAGNILRGAADHTIKLSDYEQQLNIIRNPKPVIKMYRNGGGKWHVESFEMTDHQMERFMKQNKFSAIIEIVEPT